MKPFALSLLFILTVQTLFPQEKGGFGGVAIESQDQFPAYPGKTAKSLSKSLDNYEVELFPGQKFDGWYYFWSTEGTLTCNYKGNPEVNWVSNTPKKFTSKGCSDIIPVKFSFLAPEEEGDYEVILIDSLSNWSNLTVRLRVTSAPVSAVIRSYGINMDSISYKHFAKWSLINFSTNNCIKDYLPADTATFSYNYKPPKTWLNISPLSGKFFRDNIFELRSRIIKRQYDSTWVVYNKEFSSYPILFHYYVKQTEPKNYLLHFNGENIITTGYYPSNSTKTLMYWVRFDTISNQGFGAHDFENHRFYLGIQSDNRLFAGFGNSYTPVTYLNLIPGKWYHMAMTTSQDPDSAYVYINANEVSRFAYSFSGESKASMYVGARNDSVNTTRYPVKGMIDEVQVWERPLNRNEILKYMFSPPGGNENGLVIYYSFDEGWGNFTKNAVDNYYYGTLYYGPQWIDSIKRPIEAPPKPILLTPVDNTSGVSTSPVLTWNATARTDYYNLQVSFSSDFTLIVLNQSIVKNTSFSLLNLIPGITYYWRVSACNADGSSDFSDTWKFITEIAPDRKGKFQQIISSAGISTNGTGSQLSWTIGEPVIEILTSTNADNILTQGFHQSKLDITIVDRPAYPGIILTVYPNPVSSVLQLETKDEIEKTLSLRLYDSNGKLLLNKKIETQSTLINMGSYSYGTYILKIFRNNKESLQTFKIVKN